MLQVWRAARRVRPPLRLKQARVPVTIERIFLQARVRYCLVCLHPEDPTLPVRCASESCSCHGKGGGGLCSYDSEVDGYAYSRVASHLKKQGPCDVRVLSTGILLTPDSGHVKISRPKSPKPDKAVRGAVKKPAMPRQRRQYDGPDGILDRLEAKVKGG